MSVRSTVLFFYSIFFLCMIATRCVWAEWDGEPQLEMKYEEHEFLAACREGNVPAVEFYLNDNDFDPDQCFKGGISGNKVSGLFLAAQEGHDKVVEILVHTEGVDLNKTFGGATPLFIASQNGYDKVVQILAHIEGVDINKTWNGATPLFQASQNGHDKVVKTLLEAGADPTIKWHFNFIFSKEAITQARNKRPNSRRTNPAKYDAYTRIIASLKLAEREWKRRPLTPINHQYDHSNDEKTPLLHGMRRLSVSAKPSTS